MSSSLILNTFNINLPIRNIKFKDNPITLSCQDYSIDCELNSDALLISNQSINLYPRNISISSTSISLTDFVQINHKSTSPDWKNDGVLNVSINEENNEETRMIIFKNYFCWVNDKILNLTVFNEQLKLYFHQVDKPKFVKNEKLQTLLNPSVQTSQFGLLSMDQLGRIMLESQNCQYPVIGIWFKSQQINHILVYAKVCQFLFACSKNLQKCLFKYAKKQWIYFVHISQSKVPELYLVSWECSEGGQFTIKKQLKNRQNIKIDFNQNQEDDLEFTLRNREETPMKLMEQLKFQEKLNSMQFPSSPVFSSIKKPFSQDNCQNCQKLNQQVKEQQNQIKDLKTQISKLCTQLWRIKQCMSSPSQKPLLLIKSPLYNVEDSVPRTNVKKLTESDLNVSNFKLNSASTREKKSSFEISSNSKRLRRIITEDQDDPWDHFQIIE